MIQDFDLERRKQLLAQLLADGDELNNDEFRQQHQQQQQQHSFEQSRVELAHWAHQLHLSRSEHQNSSGGTGAVALPDSLDDAALSMSLADYDLLSYQDIDSASSMSARSPAVLPMHLSRLMADSSIRDVVWEETVEAPTDIGTFEVLSTDFALPPKDVMRTPPVSLAQWNSWFQNVPTQAAKTHADPYLGRLIVPETAVRSAIFAGGLSPEARPEAWRFLFGMFPWSSSRAERQRIRAEKQAQYEEYKAAWKARIRLSARSGSPGSTSVRDELLDTIVRI
eukprot:jgi/Hompol1/2839/HPOL_006183-RA